VIINDIILTNFKNYQNRDFQFSNKINAIVGLNGMGKTNLMDAIYYLALGKSYFSSSDRLVAKLESDFFRLEGSIDGKRIVVKVQPSKMKSIEVDGVGYDRLLDYIGHHPTVVIAPSDIQQLVDGSEYRRIFINNTIVQYDSHYLSQLMVYNRLLKQRNALLKSYVETRQINKDLLDSITHLMLEPGNVIFKARKSFVERLKPIFLTQYELISSGKEKVDILYSSDMSNDQPSELFLLNKTKDMNMGRTTRGVHRDDVVFSINGQKLKDFASQGQLKSFVLSLKLAQYAILGEVTRCKPFLLLDDIFDKLDPIRVEHLIESIISDSFGQVFITDTNEDRVPTILSSKSVNFEKILI
jgi:DNA replication and repair protein RecF